MGGPLHKLYSIWHELSGPTIRLAGSARWQHGLKRAAWNSSRWIEVCMGFMDLIGKVLHFGAYFTAAYNRSAAKHGGRTMA